MLISSDLPTLRASFEVVKTARFTTCSFSLTDGIDFAPVAQLVEQRTWNVRKEARQTCCQVRFLDIPQLIRGSWVQVPPGAPCHSWGSKGFDRL